MGKYEIMFYNALISIIPAILIAYVTGDLHKVSCISSFLYSSSFSLDSLLFGIFCLSLTSYSLRNPPLSPPHPSPPPLSPLPLSPSLPIHTLHSLLAIKKLSIHLHSHTHLFSLCDRPCEKVA